MSIEENKAVVRRWNEEVFSVAGIKLIGEVLDDDYSSYAQVHGLEHAAKHFGEIIKKNPDIEAKVEEMIAEGDKVVARITHHIGGKPASEGVAIYRLLNGKIADDRFYFREIKQ